MFTFSSTILAILITVAAGISFTGGYTISSWRSAAQIARLSSANSVLTSANDRCKTDVESVQKGVNDLVSHYEGKIAAAKAEAAKAQPKADKHAQAAITIVAAPIRDDETLCKAVEREQVEYVEARRYVQ